MPFSKDISFTADSPELAEIQRRQALAQMLQQQSMSPIPNRMAGRMAVPISPMEGLAKVAQGYAGGLQQERALDQFKELRDKNEAERAADRDALVKALQGQPAIESPPDSIGGGPGRAAIPGSPEQAAQVAFGSRFSDIRQMAPGLLTLGETQKNRVAERQFRSQEAQLTREDRAEQQRLAREQRMQELTMRLQDARATAQDRMAMQRELAELQRQTQLTIAQGNQALRRDMLTQGNKPPAGYRYTPDGNLEAIPGGPADTKIQGAYNADTAALQSNVSALDRLEQQVKLVKNSNLGRITGITGALPNIPGSEGSDAQARLNALKYQVGMGAIQELRNTAKTGASGLGQITEKEHVILQNLLGSLENAQSESEIRRVLDGIEKFASESRGRIQQAYNVKHQGADRRAAPRDSTKRVVVDY